MYNGYMLSKKKVLRMTPEMLAEVNEAAKREGRTASSWIRFVIERELRRLRKEGKQ